MTTTTVVETTEQERPVYTRTAALGLLLIAAAVAVVGAAAALRAPEELLFFGTVALLGAAAALVVWRAGTWGKVLGIVVTLGAAMTMFWLLFGLAFPASFLDFVPAVLFLVGVVLSIGGNVAALRAGRRQHATRNASGGERRIERIAFGIVAVAVVVSGALFLVGRESVGPAVAAEATNVEMVGFEFAPTEIEVAAGGQLVVRNADPFVHDFVVPSLGIAQTVIPGNDVLIPVDGDVAPGRYDVYCTLHSDGSLPPEDAGMAATLVVP